MKVIFFGTSSFAARILSHLLNTGVDIRAIVTRPDRPRGRNMQFAFPPVKEIGLKAAPSIPIYQPEKASTPEFEAILRSHPADLYVVVAYGEIIKKHILDLPRLGCINIHASLLPTYRGAAPIQRALMDGVKETGITIIEMTPKMDAGDILASASVPVSEDLTYEELEPQLCQLGAQLVCEVIRQFEVGSVTKVPQDPSQATFAPKITPEDEEVDWRRTASAIHNQVRALSPTPSAWFKIFLGAELRRVKIKRSLVISDAHGAPGDILLLNKGGWIIACGIGALRLIEVQLEGKKTMPVADFIKGLHQSPVIVVKAPDAP